MEDSLHLVEQGNVKLAKSIVSTLTPQINQMNFYSDVSKQSVPASISFSFKEDDFPPLTNVCRPVSKSGNCSNHVTARSTVVSSNVSGHVKRLYQCKHVKAVCSSNVSKQNYCNVSSVSKLVKPLTVSKPVCLTIVSKSNIFNASIVSQHVKPLNVSKSMSSCNVGNRNVHIVNNISHHTKPLSESKSDSFRNVSKPVICKPLHVKPLKTSKSMSSCNVRIRHVYIVNSISHDTKPLSVSKSDCFRDVSKPVIRESVVVKISNSARKRSFNVSSHKNGVTKSLNVRSILMTSIYFYELVLLFFIFHHNFCNGNADNFFKGYVTRHNFSRNKFLNYDRFIYHDVNIFILSHANVLSSSDRCYPFSFYFCKYSCFIYSAFNDIFYVNNITNIFDNNLYITDLLNRDKKFLYCNCKVTGESIISFEQENRFKVYKIFITLENNSVFVIIIFIIFRSFSRK